MSELFLGLDVSTTASTALVVHADGALVAREASPHRLFTPQPQWSEQDPHDWWQASITAIRRVLKHPDVTADAIQAIGLTGQMHGSVFLDAAGEVLRPCILWNDQRTTKECEEITARVGAEEVLRRTGNPVLTGFTAGKILWVEHNEPERHARMRHVLLPKDYLRYRLTGDFASDVSDASGTSLFDVGKRVWSSTMLAAVGVEREQLPTVYESKDVCGEISHVAAHATGLRAGTVVVAGAGDQAAGAVGSGIVRDGMVSISLGTSGVVFAPTAKYRVEPEGRLHAFAHAVPGQWHLMGVMLSAAGSLRWFRDTVQPGASYDDLIAEALTAPPGAEGLLFLPYLTGERTPHPDPDARGAFVGLTLRHGRAHLARAVLEGVSFGLLDSLELMRGLGVEATGVRVTGGGAKSAAWRQLLADVIQAPVTTVNSSDAGALGAAALAAAGVRRFPSVGATAEAWVEAVETIEPGPNAGRYRAAYAEYRALYPALEDRFRAMGEAGEA